MFRGERVSASAKPRAWVGECSNLLLQTAKRGSPRSGVARIYPQSPVNVSWFSYVVVDAMPPDPRRIEFKLARSGIDNQYPKEP